MTACVVVTFWWREISSGAAPISGDIWSATTPARSHQESSQARTPRSPHRSAYACNESYTPRGIAPSELLIKYVVRSRIGNSPRQLSSSSMRCGSRSRLGALKLSPNKVTHGKEDEPRRAGKKSDVEVRDPPGGNEYGQQR
ncbi:MAG: hypothetical protein DMG34_05930, partial [Acidobacteria bacterium]